MRSPELEIHETQEEGWRRLTLLGELDLATTPVLEERLTELRDGHRAVLMDLSELDFMDSTGLAVMIKAIGSASADGWRFAIASNLAPQIRKLFKLTHLDQFVGKEHDA